MGGARESALVGASLYVSLPALRGREVVTVEADNVEFASMGDVKNALEREHVGLGAQLDEGSGINLISKQALQQIREEGIIATDETPLGTPLLIKAANGTTVEGGRSFVILPIVFHLKGGTQTIVGVQFNIVERLSGTGLLVGSAFSGLGDRRNVARYGKSAMLEFEVSAKSLSGKRRQFVVRAEKRTTAPPLLRERGSDR